MGKFIDMSRFFYWLKKAFNRRIGCKSFCPTCEYYEICRLDGDFDKV